MSGLQRASADRIEAFHRAQGGATAPLPREPVPSTDAVVRTFGTVTSGRNSVIVETSSRRASARKRTMFARVRLDGPDDAVLLGVGALSVLIARLTELRDRLVAHEAAQAAEGDPR